MTHGLVACVKQKRSAPAPARELDDSVWFRKARQYVEARCDRWWILSAKYGLVAPAETIAPYGKTLRDDAAEQRREWAQRILEGLGEVLTPEDTVILLAGRLYREHLVEDLQERVSQVEIPMEGLGIGEQLQFLTQQNANRG